MNLVFCFLKIIIDYGMIEFIDRLKNSSFYNETDYDNWSLWPILEFVTSNSMGWQDTKILGHMCNDHTRLVPIILCNLYPTWTTCLLHECLFIFISGIFMSRWFHLLGIMSSNLGTYVIPTKHQVPIKCDCWIAWFLCADGA